MRLDQHPIQLRLFWQCGEEMAVIGRQPAIKGAITATFEGQQQPNGDNFTRMKIGQWMLFDSSEPIIDNTKHADDTVVCGHTRSPDDVISALPS